MSDASLTWGEDLAVSASGDLSLTTGPDLTQQRVLRRLLTNREDYTWQPQYGGGLGAFVGQSANGRVIEGVLRAQMFLEAAVAHQPEPVISVDVLPDGSVLAGLSYVDAPTRTSQTLTFTVGV